MYPDKCSPALRPPTAYRHKPPTQPEAKACADAELGTVYAHNFVDKLYGAAAHDTAVGGSQVAQFFDDIRVFPQIGGQHRNFYINLTMLLRALQQLPKDALALRTRLAARILNYGYKFSTRSPETVQLGSGNPIQAQDWKNGAFYHRTDATNLYIEFSKALAHTLRIPRHQLTAVTGMGIHALVQRNHVLHGQKNVCTWQDGGALEASPEAIRVQAFAANFPNIAQAMLQIMSPDARCLTVDISENLAQLAQNCTSPREVGLGVHTLQNYVRDVIAYGVLERVKADDTLDDAAVQAKVQEVMAYVDDKIMLSGMLKIGRQHVLYQGLLGDAASDVPAAVFQGAQVMSVGELKKKHAASEAPERPGGSEPEKSTPAYDSMLGGFVPPPLFIMESWFEMAGNIEPIFRALGLETRVVFELPRASQDLPLPFFKSFGDFLAHESFVAFKALAQASDEAYLTILPNITCKLVESLQSLGVHEAFEAAHLQPLLQFCYQRMVCSMHHAANDPQDFLVFLKNINLIHEEIATLLAVREPYQADDFEPVMLQVLQASHQPTGIQPKLYFKNSGMSCLYSAVSAMEVCKASTDPAGSPRLRIGVCENNYFENSSFLRLADFHDLGKTPTSTRKLDVYVGHFHPSCEITATRYAPKDVAAMVDTFFESGMVAEHILVVIDNTISMSDERTMTDFLTQHQQKIADQKLSVVEMRSLQKTAQAGFDMYAGGSVAVYSRCATLLHAFATQETQTAYSSGNLQGILHFEKTLGAELDERRMAIVRTARQLNNPDDDLGFPAYMQASAYCTEPIQVLPNDDLQSPFVHLRLQNFFVETTADILGAHLTRKASKEPTNFPLMHRSSFGFNQTSVDDIGTHMRLSPGLEPRAIIKNYRDYIVLLNGVLREGIARFPNQKEAVMANVLAHGDALIECIRKCQADAQFAARPATQKTLEYAWDRVIFPV
jgi:hypothetical protein